MPSGPSKEISFKPITAPHAVFVGRDEYVETAIKYLCSTDYDTPMADVQIKFRCLVIHALGGYGKTQTARKIVMVCSSKRNNHFKHFVWIDSENDMTIVNGFIPVMKEIGRVCKYAGGL